MSDLLQTQPYLTRVPARETSGIVYAIDELEPVEPDVTPPDGAAVAVIGLDRSVVWLQDLGALDALQRTADAPVTRESLVGQYGDRIVSDWLVAAGCSHHPVLASRPGEEVTRA